MKNEIQSSSIKIINTRNSGTKIDSGYRAQHFIHELELKDQDKGLDPLATKYAIYIAAQESRIHHAFDAIEENIIPRGYAALEIEEANKEIAQAWENIWVESATKPEIVTYLNSALTVLRTYGSVVASQDTFKILFDWADNQISTKMDMRTALLIQGQKSEELRAANDHNYGFFKRTVERIFTLDDRDKTRKAINNLVDVANREPWSSIKFFIYDALGEYYAEHIHGNDNVNPDVACHMSSILETEPFITDGGILVETTQLENCVDFDFILKMRQERIDQLNKTAN